MLPEGEGQHAALAVAPSASPRPGPSDWTGGEVPSSQLDVLSGDRPHHQLQRNHVTPARTALCECNLIRAAPGSNGDPCEEGSLRPVSGLHVLHVIGVQSPYIEAVAGVHLPSPQDLLILPRTAPLTNRGAFDTRPRVGLRGQGARPSGPAQVRSHAAAQGLWRRRRAGSPAPF
ncbi:hypothetical protein AAFF_G00106000 [Aldrovandia affinis]|uniref:Uncharacterized protein n=1 Tax=Aldrovandia affinis TaxID=143900 RepID=A0AAD7T290_9TELE|nr:hypothetical protein AAFF_G00106000 [Aldrovandia affinis]